MKSEELWAGRLVRFINKEGGNDSIWPNGTLCTVVRKEPPGDLYVYVKRHDNNEEWLAGLDEFEPYVEDEVYPELTQEDINNIRAVSGITSFEADQKLLEGFEEDFDLVNKPKHYQLLPGVEVIDVLDALCAKLDKSEQHQFSSAAASYYAQAMGYLMRCMDKNGKQDVQKAIWYLQRLDSIWEEV